MAALCDAAGCRLLEEHAGPHAATPSSAWGFMDAKDVNKLAKAGYATPRGGAKGAYQNHVVRSNRVIVPFERLAEVPLDDYRDGYVIRLLPEQFFLAPGTPNPELAESDVVVGENAFVLYRTHKALDDFPPLDGWTPRHLEKDGRPVKSRGRGVLDIGQFVIRIPRLSNSQPKISAGAVQGVFATEYADGDTNFLSRCILAWLIVRAAGSPYVDAQAEHLRAILEAEGLLSPDEWEQRGVLRRGVTCCPLCARFIRYPELHQMVSFLDAEALENAGEQIAGATRSTIVNLFHLDPLTYSAIEHTPDNVAWGHALCNTRLGQRRTRSLPELREAGRKVAVEEEDGDWHTFGWISDDYEMIRGPRGGVWIRLTGDLAAVEFERAPDDYEVREEAAKRAAEIGTEYEIDDADVVGADDVEPAMDDS